VKSEGLYFFYKTSCIEKNTQIQTVQSGGSQQKGAGSQLWGTWSLIGGSGSHKEVPELRPRWDPPNLTPVSFSWQNSNTVTQSGAANARGVEFFLRIWQITHDIYRHDTQAQIMRTNRRWTRATLYDSWNFINCFITSQIHANRSRVTSRAMFRVAIDWRVANGMRGECGPIASTATSTVASVVNKARPSMSSVDNMLRRSTIRYEMLFQRAIKSWHQSA